ncbi:hypothetical protein B0T19DRAFT_432556 [Cercophora scortea]|uniref:Uncharacterized protein n=1 Tax=Cercophora scortea TaxID=314031 RepID=A0AAE0M698_9PEZI|nr:hypothetical protein B0T19DRAFT_432556 [Cercophora scortea]
MAAQLQLSLRALSVAMHACTVDCSAGMGLTWRMESSRSAGLAGWRGLCQRESYFGLKGLVRVDHSADHGGY